MGCPQKILAYKALLYCIIQKEDIICHECRLRIKEDGEGTNRRRIREP